MEEQEVYTITIVRNIGIPISFTIKRWKVLFLFAFLVSFVVMLILGSIDYLFLRLESKNLSQQLNSFTKKNVLLSQQIKKLDHDRYWTNTIEKEKEISSTREKLIEQPEFSTDGIWVTNKPTISEDEIQEGRNVEIESFNPSVNGDTLRLTVRVKNTSNPPQVVGGYLNITLVNNDQSPPVFKTATGGGVGDNGFPSSYKSGKPYYIKRRSSRSQVKFKLTDVNEYYTDAMIFLFSYKGRLLYRDQFALKKEIFLE